MKTILVPTDYSDNAHHALRFAFYMSGVSPVRICVFHWTEILIPTSTPQHLYKEKYEEIKNAKTEELKSDTLKVLKSLEVDEQEVNIFYFLKDSASLEESLVETAKEIKADLIVMGTLGASGMKKIFLGSNTSKIIDKAEIPTVAVPAGYFISPIRKIAYASDLKEVKKEVGELVNFAKLFNATIEIFNVHPSFPEWVDPTPENLEKISQELHQAYPGQKFNVHVVQTYKDNDTVYGIKKFVDGYKPDMLAMFTVKRTFWDKLFDPSRTEEVAFDTDVPLLTLKKR
jgi:nucleotide-binding universal stress UspA family protein